MMPLNRVLLVLAALAALAACKGLTIGPPPEHSCPPYCAMEP
ncbi:MAG TPA: hypothetical protein VFA50_23170 [Stellaceae bacterium]|nr:hypothetical protein [Stellaceae bacterium]